MLAATAEMTDKKVTEARERLSAALERGKLTCEQVQEKARQGVRATDETVRSHPYESIGVAFGAGLLIGLLLRNRD